MFIIPNIEETFSFINDLMHSDEGSVVCEYTVSEARFSDLRNLFHSEKNKLLQLAPKLVRKSIYPTSIERQNVSLALSVFDSTNVAALEVLKSQGIEISDGTIQFLRLIIKWWKISNVQHPMKGKYTKDDDANPITGPNDSKLLFLESLKTYVDIWHASDSHGKLTNETYIAFSHTLAAVVQLCKYIFNRYNWSYILTAKLQTDALEARFGAYRRLSGCTYNVSVEQILESERKLKVIGLLKLRSTKHGEFTLNDFAAKVNSNIKDTTNEKLESALEELASIPIMDEDLKVLFCMPATLAAKYLKS